MDNKALKKILKLALVIYVASFFIINWNDVAWIFNYRVVYGMASDFFNPYPSIEASALEGYFYPNHSNGESAGSGINVKTKISQKQNILEIPKLLLETPIVFSSSSDKSTVTKDLDLGVVYYPGSVLPGQAGQIVILGHSAPPGWPKIKHDWVFSELDALSPGDEVLIDLNGKQYRYIVKEKTIVQRGEDVPNNIDSENSNILTLISCWPPGKDYQRITVSAELVDNI